MENWINLRQERDFGEKFNATFTFARQNFKNLFTCILFLGTPLMIVYTLLLTYVISGLKPESFDFIPIITYFAVAMLIAIIAQVWLTAISYSYIAEYLDGNRMITPKAVFNRALRNILPLIGGGIVSGLITFIGLFMLIIPGIYLGIALSFVTSIIVFEQSSIGNAISRSMTLIIGKWWSTLGLILVMGLVVVLMSLVFSIPQSIINLGSQLAGTAPNFTVGYVITSLINVIGNTLLYPLLYITIAFQYFNLVEHKESAGLKSEIDNIAQQQTTENKGNEGEY